MTPQHPLQVAFENVAGHITNLEKMQSLIQEIIDEHLSIPDCVVQLEHEIQNAEVTLVTDIRILINEIKHISREKSPG